MCHTHRPYLLYLREKPWWKLWGKDLVVMPTVRPRTIATVMLHLPMMPTKEADLWQPATRPIIAHVMGRMIIFMEEPREEHV